MYITSPDGIFATSYSTNIGTRTVCGKRHFGVHLPCKGILKIPDATQIHQEIVLYNPQLLPFRYRIPCGNMLFFAQEHRNSYIIAPCVLITIFLFVFTLFCAVWRFVPNLDNHPFFMDEHEFVRKSYFYTLYFVNHNLSDPRWYDKHREDAVSTKVGPIYGLVLPCWDTKT